MRLFHYGQSLVQPIALTPQTPATNAHNKPKGLWVSANDHWAQFCLDERGGLTLPRAWEIALRDDVNVLRMSNADDLDTFTREYAAPTHYGHGLMNTAISWRAVAREYDGVIIAPYVRARRFDLLWYSDWDVASGCIWHPRAIASIDEIDPREIPVYSSAEDVVDSCATNAILNTHVTDEGIF